MGEEVKRMGNRGRGMLRVVGKKEELGLRLGNEEMKKRGDKVGIEGMKGV